MTDIANDRLIFHPPHVLERNDMIVAGCADKNICLIAGVVHGDDPETFHRCLQRADRIDLGDPDDGAQPAQGLSGAFAHVAVAADHRDLAGNHHVGRALDAVDQRFTAAIEVVKLRFGDRIIDVDGRKGQFALFHHAVQDAPRRWWFLR